MFSRVFMFPLEIAFYAILHLFGSYFQSVFNIISVNSVNTRREKDCSGIISTL